jgi:hypothetical protein
MYRKNRRIPEHDLLWRRKEDSELRKRSWPTAWQYTRIRLEEVRKPTKWNIKKIRPPGSPILQAGVPTSLLRYFAVNNVKDNTPIALNVYAGICGSSTLTPPIRFTVLYLSTKASFTFHLNFRVWHPVVYIYIYISMCIQGPLKQ